MRLEMKVWPIYQLLLRTALIYWPWSEYYEFTDTCLHVYFENLVHLHRIMHIYFILICCVPLSIGQSHLHTCMCITFTFLQDVYFAMIMPGCLWQLELNFHLSRNISYYDNTFTYSTHFILHVVIHSVSGNQIGAEGVANLSSTLKNCTNLQTLKWVLWYMLHVHYYYQKPNKRTAHLYTHYAYMYSY